MIGAFILTSTLDNTDRTAEIRKMLEENGFCSLSPGKFVVKNLVMPEGYSLFGCGNATKVVLSSDVEEGFAIRLQSYCTVKDFELIGSEDAIEVQQEARKRHGLLWLGNYDTDKTDRPWRGTVEGLTIHDFAGGGITHYNTGYNIESGINATNCSIFRCDVGINIAYWSEFNRYTNVSCARCGVGCINNGGNNVFVNCCFSGNISGYVMDNSDGKARNNSHGSMVGCTLHHSDNNEGVEIRVVGMIHGYSFTGCQIGTRKIQIKNSKGIVFSNCTLGKDFIIDVAGKDLTLFTGCSFAGQPTVTLYGAEGTRFHECYLKNGTPFSQEAIQTSDEEPDF